MRSGMPIRLSRVSALIRRHVTWAFWMRVFSEVAGSILMSSSLTSNRPEIFDRREVGAVTWPRAILPETLEVTAAPIMALTGAMSWSAVLLENRPGHLGQKFDFSRWAIFLPPLHHRGCNLFHHLLDVVIGRDGLSAWMCAGQRGLCSSSRPRRGSSGLIDRLYNRHMRAAVVPDAVILAVRCFENLEGRLVAEDNKPPVFHRPVLAGFGEFQLPALLVLGPPGLQLELGRLQLEPGLQIAVASRL